jgi:hypothetical protein
VKNKKELYVPMAEQAEKWAAEAKTETAKEGWLRIAEMWRLLANEDAPGTRTSRAFLNHRCLRSHAAALRMGVMDHAEGGVRAVTSMHCDQRRLPGERWIPVRLPPPVLTRSLFSVR